MALEGHHLLERGALGSPPPGLTLPHPVVWAALQIPPEFRCLGTQKGNWRRDVQNPTQDPTAHKHLLSADCMQDTRI